MADNRATLKAFFETGDIPTQAQFAALIDGLLSLIDDSNLQNGLKIKSQTDGKLQLVFNDTGLQMTTDGGTFVEAVSLFLPTFIELSLKNETLGLFFSSSPNEVVKLRGNTLNNDLPVFAIADEADIFDSRGLFITEKTLKGLALIPSFDDDAAAGSGGLTKDDFYQTTGAGGAPLNVAGIVMLKQ